MDEMGLRVHVLVCWANSKTITGEFRMRKSEVAWMPLAHGDG